MRRAALLLALLPLAPASLAPAAEAGPSGSGPALAAFARCPVLHEGRVKPLDSVARGALLALSRRQTVSGGGARMSADRWLLEVLAAPDGADALPVFAVDDPLLREALGAPRGRARLSYAELEPSLPGVLALAARVESLGAGGFPGPARESRVARGILDLGRKVELYRRLKRSGLPGDDAAFAPLPPLGAWQGALDSYRRGDARGFEARCAEYAAAAAAAHPGEARRARLEASFNEAQPFSWGMGLYLCAFLLCALSWSGLGPWTRRSSAWACLGGFGAQTLGLLARMVLQGRPPVTNLYSCAVFVAWIGVLCALWLERTGDGDGVSVAAGSGLGFCGLLVAHHLSLGGDTLPVMQAVLDSNFWLTTHVVTISVGYGTSFLASAFAHAYLFRSALGREGPAGLRRLSDRTLAVLRFSLAFTLAGTALGGIWADHAWGRFWGWDPKECGALAVVLWQAVILHLRAGRLAGEAGIMALTMLGSAVTALAWFGVDMLGVGLHAYGSASGAGWLAAFVLAEAAAAAAAVAAARRPAFTDRPIVLHTE